MLLHKFVDNLAQYFPDLHSTLTVHDFTRFATLASEVVFRSKGTISNEADSIIPFLRNALHLSLPKELCYQLWHTTQPNFNTMHIQPGHLIQQHGYSPDLTTKIPEYTLVSPVKQCLVCAKPHILQLRSRMDRYLYDVDGVHTASIVTLKCSGCSTHYRPSYHSKKKFAPTSHLRTGAMRISTRDKCSPNIDDSVFYILSASISNFNLANLFNRCYVDDVPLPPLAGAPKVRPKLSEVTCRDALDINSLLQKLESAGACLRVDTSVAPEHRYHKAMKAVVEWIALEGSKHHNHACSACVRVIPLPTADGRAKLGYIRAVVTDGITIGHWRCTATSEQLRELANVDGQPAPNGPCTTPLASVSDRFCPEHHNRLGKRCVAQPCKRDATNGTATCDLQEHVDAPPALGHC
ncbi:uncharacterized protein MELLADRAFT_87134 [Melampsora larici-populina 98AG31]|uniref:CxC5 like cysteine cluster associated with KDZ domain-containing protein n=1 Tax=Melampsora larici-populina (strain 98AG31 / pathotype 3-4-7) TaxID=747676 RepID=F4R4M7_MELLP|nr:uncharacterized protein MELLADRAFT_87134 [Melampsora larici-populina 98AG31]EGG12835.1 hypothetical protein MELLADRAFT_87134 [Melampsora larici-populina 98AG31]